MNRPFAILAGGMLFALPFLQSGVGDSSHLASATHMDHRPHHGGALLMLGHHHLEIVETAGELDVYVSDATRRPVRAERATVRFDNGAEQDLEWSGYRLSSPRPTDYEFADYRIEIAGAAPLAIRLPAGGVTMPTGK